MSARDQALGWGFAGTGSISATVASQARDVAGASLAAVCSRSAERAARFAQEHGFATGYGDYGALMADPAVDAVYVALPHSQHVGAVLAALDAGKHVLCEKPMGLTAAEVERIAAHPRAHALTVAEGFMLRHQPQWLWIEAQIAAGRLGEVRAVHAYSTLALPAPTDDALPGRGSVLLDIGCYAVHLARAIFRAEPLRASATVERVPGRSSETAVQAVLAFPAGRANLTVASTWKPGRRIHILGTEGSIEVFNPVHTFKGPTRLLASFADDPSPEPQEFTFPVVNQYGLQLAAFADAVQGGRPPKVPIADALGNARAIDALFASARSDGAWVDLPATRA